MEPNSDDLFCLEWALRLAHEAFKAGYSPVGAIVKDNKGGVFASASKRLIGNTLHAEFLALSGYQNTQVIGNNITLYSTLEPCVMCVGMAAIMKVERVVWLVADLWGGTSGVYNPESVYIKKRFPKMRRADFPDLYQEALGLWIKYLTATGHSDAIQYMLGLPEDYQCK